MFVVVVNEDYIGNSLNFGSRLFWCERGRGGSARFLGVWGGSEYARRREGLGLR